jgi:hypothetical protein
MKKVFSGALLLCATISAFAFSPAKMAASSNVTKTHNLWWYPTSGVLQEAIGGPANWSIGPTPLGNGITFTRSGSSWGPYAFTLQSDGSRVAAGPSQLGVIQVWIINDQVSFVTIL